MGVSALDMLRAIADDDDDPEKLEGFARRTMKKKAELELALCGYINQHQRLLFPASRRSEFSNSSDFLLQFLLGYFSVLQRRLIWCTINNTEQFLSYREKVNKAIPPTSPVISMEMAESLL